jgi:hypothetical protein
VLYQEAAAMARELPAGLGSGPGTFGRLFQVHTAGSGGTHQPHLHNDWSELRITFGWVGAAGLWLAFGLMLVRPLMPGGMPVGAALSGTIWLALAGCLAHARFDYPLHAPAVGFLFLLLCAMCSVLGFPTGRERIDARA